MLYGGGFSSSPVGGLGCSSDGLGCRSSSGVDGGDTVLRCASLLAAFSGGRGVEVLSGELTTFSSFGWEPSAPTPSTVIRFRWYTQGKLLSRPDELRMIFRYLLFNNPFTGVRGIGILRTSPFGDSAKFGFTILHEMPPGARHFRLCACAGRGFFEHHRRMALLT